MPATEMNDQSQEKSGGGGEARAARKRRAALVSVATAVTLVVIKLTAGALTNSLSLFASAIDSITDIFASIVNYFAVRAASRPADEDHANGHGKAEGLAGLFQGVVITASGLYLGVESVRRFVVPAAIGQEAIGIAVMVVSTLASYLLVRYLRRVARETESIALAADSLHYSTDVLTNAGVLVTLAIVRFTGIDLVDPIVSLAVALYIVYAAFGVLHDAVDHLMDRALPDEIHEAVHRLAMAHPEIRGVHDIKSRAVGHRRFIEIHLEIDGSKSLFDAHLAAVEVLRTIEREIPSSRVFVHTDPV
jgi:ferrous-iron efflux pump FieF